MTIDWQTMGIIISIILNIILAVLLFFKSALNDILKDMWIERKKKKEEAVKRIIKFKTSFNQIQRDNFLVILTLAQKKAAIIMGNKIDQFIENTYKDSSEKSSEIAAKLSLFFDYLPVELKNSYKRYNELYKEIIKNIMDGIVAKEDMIECTKKLSSRTSETTELIDKILSDKIDKKCV